MSESREREVVDDLLAASLDGIALLDSEGHRRVNEAYAGTFGADSAADLDGRPWVDLYGDAATERIRAAIEGEATGNGESRTLSRARCRRVDGTPLVVDVSVRPTADGAVVIVRDRSGSEGEDEDDEETLAALHDALRTIQRARSVEAVCDRAITVIHEDLGWPRVGCWRYDEDDGVLRPADGWPDCEVTLEPGDPEYAAFEAGERTELPGDGRWTGTVDDFHRGIAIPVDGRGLIAAATSTDAKDVEGDGETLNVLVTHVETAIERVERERQLRRSEHRYRTLAEYMPGSAVALYEAAGADDLRYTLVSGPIWNELTVSADELEGRLFSEVHSDSYYEDHFGTYRMALDGEPGTFEFSFEDRIFQGHTVPVENEDGEIISGMATTQDVTEQREYERELRRKERQYRTLAEHIPGAAVALFDHDLRYTVVAGSIYDEIDQARRAREGTLIEEFHNDEFVENHLSKFEAALAGEEATFQYTAFDRTFDAAILPVIDDGEVISGLIVALDVTDRVERERELERQRDELETLNRINGLLLNITRALSEAPSREDVESIVCERLAESDLYRFAWIGEYVPGDEVIVPRTSAGVEEGYLEAVSITAGRELTGLGPGGEAVRTGEVQVVGDVREDDRFEPWREPATERGYRSVAAVPIVHEDIVYGLLAVYSARVDAFSDTEQTAFTNLGETIGFVINALQNRRLLVADAVTELTFEIENPDSRLADFSTRLDATVSLEGYTKTDGDTWLVYFSVDGAHPEALCETVREDEAIEAAWMIEGDETGGLIGAQNTDPTLIRSVLAAGATIESASATDGRLRIVVEVPGSTDVRTVVERLRGVYPGIEMIARRERDHAVQTATEFRENLEGALTDRQLATLRAAYYAGYFEWPRDSTAEEVAESMGIASATLHNHLRKAQQRLLTLFFEDDPGSDAGSDPGKR